MYAQIEGKGPRWPLDLLRLLSVGLVADDGGNLDADDLLLALARQLLGATLDLAIRLLGLIFS